MVAFNEIGQGYFIFSEFEKSGTPITKNFKVIVNVYPLGDGLHSVVVKRPFETLKQDMTALRLEEYKEHISNYCNWKGYELEVNYIMFNISFMDFLNVPEVNKIYYFFAESDRERAVNALFKTYERHMSVLGHEKKIKYQLDQIRKIQWNGQTFEVYYKNGDWYHYTPSGEWY